MLYYLEKILLFASSTLRCDNILLMLSFDFIFLHHHLFHIVPFPFVVQQWDLFHGFRGKNGGDLHIASRAHWQTDVQAFPVCERSIFRPDALVVNITAAHRPQSGLTGNAFSPLLQEPKRKKKMLWQQFKSNSNFSYCKFADKSKSVSSKCPLHICIEHIWPYASKTT